MDFFQVELVGGPGDGLILPTEFLHDQFPSEDGYYVRIDNEVNPNGVTPYLFHHASIHQN